MADYIYLLEHRLAPAQRSALNAVREVAREKGLTLFLVGGAVRDLTSGSPVRDLDVVIQGQNARLLRRDLEKVGAVVSGEQEVMQTLHLSFPGGVRMELGSTVSITFPKPGKPVVKPSTILDDLRRRDFTANAMALSLNEGSYGLLMDPLNGVADIENRQLRLVSNYGFIEDPVRMIRAARLMARLGWTLDERTETRYQNSKGDDAISVLADYARGYELEEIVHEEDPMRVLKRLESEGWMKVLAPFWTVAKVNVAELDRLRDVQMHLQVQGIHADTAAAVFPLLTAKLSAKEAADLKASFPRSGFAEEIDSLEGAAKEFASQLGGKAAAAPSGAWKLINAARPEVVLWASFSIKSAALQARFKAFSEEWPQARNRMPYALMQEMRITPDLPEYETLLETLFFQLMDGKLGTQEEMKAFLEPYSPPAPPPPVSLRRARTAKKEARPKSRARKAKAEAEDAGIDGEEVDLDAAEPDADVDEADQTDDREERDDLDDSGAEPEEESAPEPPARPRKSAAPAKAEKIAAAAAASPVPQEAPAVPEKKKAAAAPSKSETVTKKTAAAPASVKKPAGVKNADVTQTAKKATPQKSVPAKASKAAPSKPVAGKTVARIPAKKTAPVKASGKAPQKAVVKAPAKKAVAAKTPAKTVGAKSSATKAPAKKTAPPPAKKVAVKGSRKR